jgi:thioredoxin 2
MKIVCPQCGTANRVPDHRLDEHPVCGRCSAEMMAAKPVALGDAIFETFVAGTELPVLVDFWADWCGPCLAMAPQFEKAAAQLPHVRFVKVDSDANPKASVAHRIRSIPTLILFRGGRELARQSGAMAAADLVRWVQAQLAESRAAS